MRAFKQLKKYGSAAAAATVGAIGSAQAAVPTELSTGLTDAAIDVAAVAALALLVYFAPKVFKYMRGGL